MKTKVAQFLILCIMFTMVLPLNVLAAGSMTFEMDNNYANGNSVNLDAYTTVIGVMAHEGNYIAWGQYGNVQTSSDGINWTSGSSTWTNSSVASDIYSWEGNLSRIVYNDTEKKYVGIGENCYGSSLDGKTWKFESSSNNPENNDLLYANGKYFIAYNRYGGGGIQQSTDGKNWCTLTTGLPSSSSDYNNFYNLNGITYGQGKYIVVGSNGMVLSSSDGESWSNQALELGNDYINLNDVIYAGGQYVIVGNYGTILTSSDGVTWVKQDSGLNGYSNNLRSISYGNDKYVVVGGSKILSSTDGISWSAENSTSQYGNQYDQVCFDSAGFVATGSRSTATAFSKNGVSWTEKSLKSTQTIDNITDLQFLNKEYVAVGHGFMTSLDGVAWRKENETEDFSRISYGNGKYVGIGRGNNYQSVVKTSNDGVTWQLQTVNVIDYFSPADISFGNGKFVIVSYDGSILYSVDGANWTQATSGVTSSLNSVVYANGRFIAAGDFGTILSSIDGKNWSKADSGLSSSDNYSSLTDLAVGNGQVIGVGFARVGKYPNMSYSGAILSSSDGINWTSRQSGTTKDLTGVCYGNGRFVAIGDEGTVLSSTDGATWETEPRLTRETLGMIASNGSGFLIGMSPYYNNRLFRSTSSGGSNAPSGDWKNGFINEPINKSWTIHFNQEIDHSTVSRSTVYVATKNGSKLEQTFSYSADGKSFTLTPQNDYSSGGEYYLHVTTGVKSSSGSKALSRSVAMRFTVR